MTVTGASERGFRAKLRQQAIVTINKHHEAGLLADLYNAGLIPIYSSVEVQL
jgi:hypothetical protein